MDQATPLTCPHCAAPAATGGAFCAACGKALPTGRAPRIVPENSVAETSAGRALQAVHSRHQARKAANALLGVACLQTLFGGFIVLATFLDKNPAPEAKLLCAVLIGVALLFWALYVWAIWMPLPAAIVGLTLYASLVIGDFVADPASIARGVLVKILIFYFLIYGIRAALLHKRVMKELGR